MTTIRFKKVGIFSNVEKGILNAESPYGLYRVLRENIPIYVYNFTPQDLVELKYDSELDNLVVTYFFHSPATSEPEIRENAEEIVHTIKANRLENSALLYNVSLRGLVNYADFSISYDLYLYQEEHAFVTKVKRGFVCGLGDVTYVSGSSTNMSWDNAIFSVFNELHNISPPKNKKVDGDAIIFSVILAGRLAGINKDDLSSVDGANEGRFIYGLADINYNYNEPEALLLSLGDKLDNINAILFKENRDKKIEEKKQIIIVKKEEPRYDEEFSFVGNSIRLSSVVEMGLNVFCRSIKDPQKSVKVEIDIDLLDFKSMYIKGNMAYVVPAGNQRLDHFMELLNSDNVCFMMS